MWIYLFIFTLKNAHIRLLADCYARAIALRNVF
jgi:hypothetical protein